MKLGPNPSYHQAHTNSTHRIPPSCTNFHATSNSTHRIPPPITKPTPTPHTQNTPFVHKLPHHQHQRHAHTRQHTLHPQYPQTPTAPQPHTKKRGCLQGNPFCFLAYFKKLSLNDSTHWASVSASTAISTHVSVNFVNVAC